MVGLVSLVGFGDREKGENVDLLQVNDFNEGEVGVWKCEQEPGTSKL